MSKTMEDIAKTCPKCGCTCFSDSGTTTADVPVAWQDDDGKWYLGPAEEIHKHECGNCGWTQIARRRRGKLVEVTSP